MKYEVIKQLSYDYEDVPPWRSYEVHAAGDDLRSLIMDAHICELDQDGGELAFYPLDWAPDGLHGVALHALKSAFAEAIAKN